MNSAVHVYYVYFCSVLAKERLSMKTYEFKARKKYCFISSEMI